MKHMSRSRLKELLAEFPRRRILIAGDVMLDRFIYGGVSRISPEAPVPVVEVGREESHPGGAANTARNVSLLAGHAVLIGRIGADKSGREMQSLLRREGVNARDLLVRDATPTSVKTRIIAQHQQICRVDRERCVALSPEDVADVVQFVRAQRTFDAIIVSDYGKGFVTQLLLDALKRLAPVVTLDPKSTRPLELDGLTAITPNRAETLQLAGLAADDSDWRTAGETVLKKWRLKILLSTLGEQGMCLFQVGRKSLLIPTVAREVFDVSGAGDTVIAAFTLALASGASPVEAAVISNHAAGIVVGKLGTATCTREELGASLLR